MNASKKHFSPLSREDSPQLESVYKSAEDFYGYLPDYFLSMSRLPHAVEAYTKFCTELYDEVTLPASLAHLVSLEASIVSGCTYSIAHAAKKASDVGVPEEKIVSMNNYQNSPLFDRKERAALAFANKSAQAPSPLDKVDFDEMFNDFSETEVCEILFIVAQTGFHNRWNDSVSTSLEQPPADFAKTNLPSDLWNVGKHG